VAFKSKAGLEKERPVSFYALLKAYGANSTPELRKTFPAAEQVYEVLSRKVAHATKLMDLEELAPIISRAGGVLRQLELTAIGKDRIEAIASSLEKRQTE
jgi:hypothetical protein